MELIGQGDQISQVYLPSFLQFPQNFLHENPRFDLWKNAAHIFIFLELHCISNAEKIAMKLTDLIQEVFHIMMVHFIGVVHKSQFQGGSFGQ